MPTRDTPFAAGTPCWVDLATSDADRSLEFYGTLFGWTSEGGGEEFGGYLSCFSDGHRVAGVFPKTPDMQMPDVWTTYFAVDDAQSTCDKITDAGGMVMQTPMAVGDLGTMAIGVDPAGGVFGLWQAGTHTGFGKYNEPGSVTWDEHHSKEFAKSTPFYEKVFGWSYDKSAGDTDDFRYYQAQVDGETVAGLMDSKSFLPEQVPSHWSLYFSVEDVDEAAAKAKELGASVMVEPTDTPYGRMADLADPTGAMFKLHSNKLANPPAEDGESGQG